VEDEPTHLLKLPEPISDVSPVREHTRDGRTTYLLDMHMHRHGGHRSYHAELGRDGSGKVYCEDTDFNHGGLALYLSFEVIERLHEAAVDARRSIPELDNSKEGA
jgi:hypothetical protein